MTLETDLLDETINQQNQTLAQGAAWRLPTAPPPFKLLPNVGLQSRK